ncbi:bifunctional Inositol polyphosphate kinase/Histone deacetylase domain/Eukaryotic translation initiation factor 3 subunit D/Histone deacetylase domain superfamily/Ureohydrolase domain superfamily/Histone deacetylase family/Inositol polyphosphate kinase superfamily [Babesia duncani]|uniref:Eukaryotic translation initiation factor 3 subunit D n=1 Tax=Babesia duncani TaxID=323732 RepID=A0AAD9UNH1_9APIC|nr:bifunctional Inositol polyphosphate kinase/Histone deacetylase domain/Eukaryotic translation initiation factor 3 subunit D/Histone deacetylase domain superfamily/Ureohydrolase domain superfamily/Histone deacetylase family/Inositol polyphosphate kinase superfamily [Babesia duncani]
MSDSSFERPLMAVCYDEDNMCSNKHWDLLNPYHPECPDRVGKVLSHLKCCTIANKTGNEELLWNYFKTIPCKTVDNDILRMAHSEKMLHTVSYWTRNINRIMNSKKISKNGTNSKEVNGITLYPFDNDTFMTLDTDHVARLAVGGVLELCDVLYNNSIHVNKLVKKVFALVRPPGHHATPVQSMGFCVYNNVAIAAKYIMQKYSINKIAIIDWDVHHGNGTQDIFYNNPNVCYISIHRYGEGSKSFYPYCGHNKEIGEGEGKGYNLNFNLEEGFGDYDVMYVFDNVIVPYLNNFKPQLVIISAGFDAATNDYLGGCFVEPSGYKYMTKRLCEIAERFCDGKLMLVLEGGYNIEVMANCIEAVIATLLEYDMGIETTLLKMDTRLVKDSTMEICSKLLKVMNQYLVGATLDIDLAGLELRKLKWIDYNGHLEQGMLLMAAGHENQWILPLDQECDKVAKLCNDNEVIFYEWLCKCNDMDITIFTSSAIPLNLPIEDSTIPCRFGGLRISNEPASRQKTPDDNSNVCKTLDIDSIPIDMVARQLLKHVTTCHAIYKSSVFESWNLSGNKQSSIRIQNALDGMKVPCVMDLKMGTRLYGDDLIDDLAIKQKIAKASSRSCLTHGFHISGIFKWDVENGTAKYLDESCLYASKTDEQLSNAFTLYFNESENSGKLIEFFMTKLKELEDIFKTQEFLALYGTSLLFVYDASKEVDSVATARLYMIDFSHVSYNVRQLDGGYLLGLETPAYIPRQSLYTLSTMEMLNIISNINLNGWGPDEKDEQTVATCLGPLNKFPLELNLKVDRQIRICDFTYGTYQRNIREGGRYNRHASGVIDEEMQFQTVDGRSLGRSKNNQYYKKRVVLKQTTQAFNQKQLEEEAMLLAKQKHPELRRQKIIMQNRQARMNTRHHTFNEWSIEPGSNWTVVAEIPFSQLIKIELAKNDVQVNDLFFRGKIGIYDKKMDHISIKNEVALQNVSKGLDYYWTSTHDDDCIAKVLLETYNNSTVADKVPDVSVDEVPKSSIRNKPLQYEASPEAQQLDRNILRFDKIVVAATDQILAVIMTAARSKYSWHLNVTKIENQIIIDKANGSIVDMLTVNETAPEPPMQDAENKINRPPALGCEAVRVNQNIRQQLLLNEIAETFEDAPFIESGDNPAVMGYRYRTFTIPGDSSSNTFEKLPIFIITRAEVHAKLPSPQQGYTYICALNEFPSKNHKSWRSQIETQKGALLANEIRNNTTKLQRFAACAAIGGCDTLKLAFVTRRGPNDAENHQILSVQSHTTENLAMQMGFKLRNAWGIVRSIAQLIVRKPDGHYVLLKDPLKPIIRLYSTPDEPEAPSQTVNTTSM